MKEIMRLILILVILLGLGYCLFCFIRTTIFILGQISLKERLRKFFKLIILAGLSYGMFCFGVTLVLTMGQSDGELRTEEIKLFAEIKKELNLKKITREPMYNISNPKKDEPYTLYFKYINCDISKDSINKLAKKYVLQIDKDLILTHQFSSIEIFFYTWNCDTDDSDFHFSRKDINELKNDTK